MPASFSFLRRPHLLRAGLCLAVSVPWMATSIQAQDPVVFISAFNSGDKGAIHAYQFDSTHGKLRLLNRTTDLDNPFFTAISPNGKYLYAIDAKEFGSEQDEFIAAYAIEGRDGSLRRLNRQSSHGTASCSLDVDATGKTIVVANYSSGSVAALPVQQDGSLGPASKFVQHIGASTNPQRQKEPHAHCVVVSPDNRFVLAADLGIDKVLIYTLNADTGDLTSNESQPFAELPPGSGPRHLVFHPNGHRVYVINELLNTITFFDYTIETGGLTQRQTISTVPDDFKGTSHTADLKITPDGRFLYGTNRGHDSIAIYRISDDGHLSLVNIVPSLGKGPQNLLITPDGRWLMCANMPGNNVAIFSIDPANGSLTSAGEPIPIPMPSCIRWLK